MENTENSENIEVELDGVRSPEAQAIIDAELGIEPKVDNEEEEDVDLPSDDNADGGEPELLAGKYKSEEELVKGIKNIGSTLPEYVIDGMSVEALEKHYTEMEKSTKTEDRRPDTDKGRKFAAEEDDVKEPDDKKQPTDVSDELWSELEDEFNANGTIKSEQYDKLNEAGYSDKMIDRFMDSLDIQKQDEVRQREVFTEQVYELAGGKEELDAIKEWAEENEPTIVSTLNGMTDYNQILSVMKGVKASYDAANGVGNNTIRGNRTSSKASGYQSIADYNADVNDARYRTDTRYRDKVKAKLSKSNLTS